jgi:hypothetical protein
MAAMNAIRDRACSELRVKGYGFRNLSMVLIHAAIGIMGHACNVVGLRADYKRGHGVLTGADLPMADFEFATTTGGLCVETMTNLCASTGAVNLGVYRGRLYIMYKWLVRIEAVAT